MNYAAADRRKSVSTEGILPMITLLSAFWLICLIVWQQTGGTFAGSSTYNSYTLQALAWRRGSLSLGMDYPHLELAVYQGDWYVSFPPVPSVPLYFLTFLFGANTPDALLIKIYALIALFSVYSALIHRKWNGWAAAFTALMITLGGSMLPLISDGAVWYQAQVMAFMLTTASIALMMRGKMTPALFLYALAVGCRPFNVCYGPLMMGIWYLRQRDSSFGRIRRRLGMGIFLGLCVAACYAIYNFARFGEVFEFGHNYLPEFTRSAYGQFSLNHLSENAKRFLFGLPFYKTVSGWEFERFGCSIFLGNPMLLLMVVWYLIDLVCRRTNLSKHLIMLTFAVHLFLLLLHRTGGGYQLGARYAVDLVPYSLLYLCVGRYRKPVRWWEGTLLAAGFVMMIIGCGYVHI